MTGDIVPIANQSLERGSLDEISQSSDTNWRPSPALSAVSEEYDAQCSCGIHRYRRRFLYLVSFDLVLCTLLWTLITVTERDGISLKTAFLNQLNFKTMYTKTLFDLELLSLGRFAWLVTCYGPLGWSNWWAVLFSKNLIEYVFIVSCFIVAWVELWLMDFQVLPKENKIRNGVISPPILCPENRTQTASEYQQYLSAREFATDAASSSDEDMGGNRLGRFFRHPKLRRNRALMEPEPTKEELIARGQLAISLGRELLRHAQDWPVNVAGSPLIASGTHRCSNNVAYFLKEDFEAPVQLLFDVLYAQFDSSPSWNPSLEQCQILKSLDDSTDIFYSSLHSIGGGLISSRDFVSVRRLEKRDAQQLTLEIAWISVASGSVPFSSGKVRGEHGPNYIQLQERAQNTCSVQMIVNTDPKVRLPRRLLKQTTLSCLKSYAHCLKAEIFRRQREGPQASPSW